MNIHQQASTPHRHSSGKDIAWQQWHLIAIEDRLNPGKVAPHCHWQRQFHATHSARQFPLEIGACHTHAFFRSHGRCLWRACRKASAGHAFIRRRPRPGRPLAMPAAGLGWTGRPWSRPTARLRQPWGAAARHPGRRRRRGVRPAPLVHRAVRPVEERITADLGAGNPRAGSPGAPRTRRPGHSRAPATWGPRQLSPGLGRPSSHRF